MIAFPPKRQPLPKGLRVLCIKWGDKYTDDYVLRLQAMCARHLPPHDFVCITDDPVDGVECNPLLCDLPGWWQKVGLFQRGLFPGWNMFLDLDVVITSSLAPLVAAAMTDKSALWCVDDFGYPLRNPRAVSPDTRRMLGGVGTIQSSVMLWCGSPESQVYAAWDQFTPEVMEALHGDQNWLTQALYPQAVKFLPDGYVNSYKYGKHQQAPLSVFHGEPKPHQVADEWVLQHWAA